MRGLVALRDQLLLFLLRTFDLLGKRLTLLGGLRKTITQDFLVNDCIADALDLHLQVRVRRADRFEQTLGEFIKRVGLEASKRSVLSKTTRSMAERSSVARPADEHSFSTKCCER